MDDKPKNETGLVLGIAIIAVLIVLMLAVSYYGFKLGPLKQGPTAILLGIYIQFWGILFLLSYFYSHKTFFLRALIWMCENFSSPKGRKMAFFCFALAFGLGTAVLIQGLGLFSNNSETASESMSQIECEYLPAHILDFSVQEPNKSQNNIIISTSFENLDISNSKRILPFIITGRENWKVHDVCSKSGKYCLNIIPSGNGSSGFSSFFQTFSAKDRNYAILNSQFSDTYKPFDISRFDFVELTFWRYSTSN